MTKKYLMFINYKFWFIGIFIISILSCNKQQVDIIKYVKQWQNKEIKFTDSLLNNINNYQLKLNQHYNSYKILTYIDINGCTECNLKLPNWKNIIKEADSLKLNVSFIFIAHSAISKKIEKQKIINKFPLPIFYDTQGNFEKINKIPSEFIFQTFLLNTQNKVILIGNPIKKRNLWYLYKREIQKNDGILTKRD